MILAINTSTLQFSLAVLNEQGTILVEHLISPGAKYFRGFMPTIHSLLTSSKVNIKDIRTIVVAMGPGSFTGLRVGLSVAKGMAQGLKVPLVGVSSLEAMASQLPYTDYRMCPVIDSRKGELFLALFNWRDDGRVARISEDTSMKTEDLPSVIDKETVFLGNDFIDQGELIKKLLGEKALLAPPYLWNLRASAVGTLGLRRFQDQDFDDLQDLVPSYIRHPDIRPNPFPFITDEKNRPFESKNDKDVDKR